jgi:putative FmdB family regulatory protein
MPIYEFRCNRCKAECEVFQKMDAPPPPCTDEKCTNFGKPMDKRISGFSFELKGGGWAKDGYGG